MVRPELVRLAADLSEIISRRRFWLHLGWEDVAKQYRRSFLGPVWISVYTGVFVLTVGIVGADLFAQDMRSYLPHFATGIIFFGFFSTITIEACSVFTSAEAYLKQGSISKMIFVCRLLMKNMFILLHNLFILILVFLWAGMLGDINWFGFLLGLSWFLAAAFFIVPVVGVIATRFRDVPLMIASAMQTMFFLTPVFWRPESLSSEIRDLLFLNPFAIYLELIRRPLVGQALPEGLFTASLAVFSSAVICYFLFFTFTRRKIVYWL